MKKIEDLFRTALKDQELPYDESAWNDMSKRLDARGGSAGQLKWILGAAVVASITIGSILYVNNKETNTINTTDLKLTSNGQEFESNSTERNNEIDDVIDSQTFEDSQTPKNTTEKTINAKSKVIDSKKEELIIEEIPCCGDLEPVVEEILVPPVYREPIIEKEVKEQVPLIKTENLIFAPVSNQCKNNEWTYYNKNNLSIWIKNPTNDLIEIAARSNHKEVLEQKGIYQIGSFNEMGEFKSKTIFTVFEAAEPQIISDDALNYENGLPELIVEAYQEGKNTWTLDGEIQAKNQSTHSFNLFEKGPHVMSIKTTDVNGCHAKSSITFNVEADYNLLAVNAFSPSSLEPRNTHFIPFALTQRDTPFKMFVIDPTDGAVLFETSAADITWDGTDRNTGKMVDANKSFVWKVILEQPEVNENPEYIGTVVRL
jgi:hypothetical protein